MRKLRGQLMELQYLLKYIFSEKLSRVQVLAIAILIITGLGSFIVGLIWVFN